LASPVVALIVGTAVDVIVTLNSNLYGTKSAF